MDIKLPVYKATITDDETGMVAISLVDDPAVEINWQYFNDDKKPMLFAVQDDEKRLVRGVIMECDKLIYRRDASGFEYYIQFDAPTIRLMAQKYLRDGFQNNVDTMHDGNLVNGVELVQWFISDKDNGVNPIGFEDVNDHSLFAEFHILNDEIWNSIKEGTFRGFSLEGFFEPVEVKMQINKKSNTVTMSKLNAIRTLLQKALMAFERISTDKALIEFDGEEIEVGMAVHGVDEENNPFNLEDGEYKAEDGTIYVIADGKVAEIREVEKEPEAPAEEPAPEAPQETVENAEEVPQSEEEPEADPRDQRIADLEAEVARLEEENGALKERIAELENKPAANPASEDFENAKKVEKTGNAKTDRLLRIINA
jgi:hypothetical protein